MFAEAALGGQPERVTEREHVAERPAHERKLDVEATAALEGVEKAGHAIDQTEEIIWSEIQEVQQLAQGGRHHGGRDVDERIDNADRCVHITCRPDQSGAEIEGDVDRVGCCGCQSGN